MKIFFLKVVHHIKKIVFLPRHLPRWWNWWTRYFEGVVGVLPCKFDSCPGHKKKPFIRTAFSIHNS